MIQKYVPICFLILFLPQLLFAQAKFSDYFENNTLRVDYLLTGTDDSVEIIIGQLKKEPNFGASHTNLIDPYNMGTYRYQVFDRKTDSLIFSKGFCPLFQEWQTTEEAKYEKRSFYQVAILPFPKSEIRLVIEERNWEGEFETVFSTGIDPKDYFIIDDRLPGYKVDTLSRNGDPKNKVDVVFLPDGYTALEMDQFIADVKRLTKALFSAKPFHQHKHDFNIYAVKVPSAESGTDVPGEQLYKNTAFNSSFYTFDTPRYLTSQDMLSIHNAAALAPYDQIYLLVNTDRYGGGGFYNYLAVTSVGHKQSESVFIHEFGHSLAALADEYYSSKVAYNDYYNLDVEPWEANITTLVNFETKWGDLIGKTIPRPTPRISKFSKVVGVFEGGGYLAKGIYSPVMDCRMKSNEAKGFCPVCQRTITKVVEWHCK